VPLWIPITGRNSATVRCASYPRRLHRRDAKPGGSVLRVDKFGLKTSQTLGEVCEDPVKVWSCQSLIHMQGPCMVVEARDCAGAAGGTFPLAARDVRANHDTHV